MKNIATFLLAILLISISVKAQESKLFENEIIGIHPKAGLLLNNYSADFKQFQGSVDCGLFESGSGIGYEAGITFEKAFLDKAFAGLGIYYVDRSGSLIIDNAFRSRNLATGEVVNVSTENIIDATLSYVEIVPEIRYSILDKLINGPLRGVFAFRIGIPISSDFEQREEIASPSNAVFINANDVRTQNRDIAGGSIETINNIAYGISAGVENMLTLGGSTFFTQQISFDYNLNDITSDANWKTYAVKLDLGLRFSVQKAEELPPPPPEAPRVMPQPLPTPAPELPLPPMITLNVSPDLRNSIIQTGNELLATTPIVNAVFFDKNSATIPSNYIITKDDENISYLGMDALVAHRRLLPRIATIVNSNPDAEIILEPATSGSDEPRAMALSRERGEAVKTALIALGVNDRIIKINPRLQPRYPSNQDFTEGMAENRRVDIIVKNAPLQEWVDIQKFAEFIGSIDAFVEYSNIESSVDISSNKLNNPLTVEDPGTYNIAFKERLSSNQETIEVEVEAKSEGISEKGSTIIDLAGVPKENIDLNLENFEAILRFDYNSSELSADNKALLKQLSEKLPEGSTIFILGSTDALGTDERNAILARERAENTREYIMSVSGAKFSYETGTDSDKFDESSPQGRFLNRSIRIRVKN